MKTVHLIQHTHWDREWYFTENDSQALLYYFMQDLMDKLEADPQLGPFVLDAQTVLVDDYLQIAPENRSRLQRLVSEQRILIGPWYSQTDFLVVGAESITRNLLIGMEAAREMGSVMETGYVPDSFGQSEQLPMFLRQFGIEQAVFWRGWSEDRVKNTEFVWISPDGSEVLTAVLPWGYGCAKWLPPVAADAARLVYQACEKQARFSATGSLMLPNGNDQSPFEHRVPAMLAELNQQQDEYQFITSSFSRFFSELAPHRAQLARYRGEFLSPKYMRIHRGIFSTRQDIKTVNARLEQCLTQQLEPLLALNWHLGLPYPTHAVDKIWREAMKSHPHDSIGGCNADRVNQMVLARLQSGSEMAQQLLELNLRKLCEGIEAQQSGTKVLLFNSLPQPRSALISLTLYTPEQEFTLVDAEGNPCRYQIQQESQQDMSTIIQELANQSAPPLFRKVTLLLETPELPACGYLTLYLQEGKSGNALAVLEDRQRPVLENGWLRLTLEPNGSLTLFDKRNQQGYPDLLQIVDGGDEGDNYNYSPPKQDQLIIINEALIDWKIVRGALSDAMHLQFASAVPADLEQRRQQNHDSQLPIEMCITLPHGTAQLETEIRVDNRVRDHRLQLRINTGLLTQQHVADQPFGTIYRDNQPPEMALWQEQHWTETPAALYPMHSMVAINDGQRGIAAVTEGLREYEIPTDRHGTMAITLLRSVGWLGRANLNYRPGRASGMALPSPDSQLPGVWHQRLCIIPQHDDGNQPAFWRHVEQWRTPPVSHVGTNWARFRLNPHGKIFPSHFSLLRWETPLCFSCIKKAGNEEALVIRGYNPLRQPCEPGIVESQFSVQFSTLAERPTVSLSEVPACSPVTLILKKQGICA